MIHRCSGQDVQSNLRHSHSAGTRSLRRVIAANNDGEATPDISAIQPSHAISSALAPDPPCSKPKQHQQQHGPKDEPHHHAPWRYTRLNLSLTEIIHKAFKSDAIPSVVRKELREHLNLLGILARGVGSMPFPVGIDFSTNMTVAPVVAGDGRQKGGLR